MRTRTILVLLAILVAKGLVLKHLRDAARHSAQNRAIHRMIDPRRAVPRPRVLRLDDRLRHARRSTPLSRGTGG